ncbi:MAG: HDOD domain-containing protein [Azoarcus sp.]|jgi:EAL and modified HD-GYP domain-containing signal transduction protein|nr:HDOD domain-containing protein [Azoarcus sp.]
MLNRLFHWLCRRSPSPAKDARANTAPPPVDALNQQAPLRQPSSQEHARAAGEIDTTIICREAVLDRQQKIIGYQFMLQDAAHDHIRSRTQRIFHLYAEVLVENLVRANIGPLLGRRLAFVEVPDSFLLQPALTRLSPDNTYIILQPMESPGAPAPEELRARIQDLRASGYRIGIPSPITVPAYSSLLPEVDLVCVQAPRVDVGEGVALVRRILRQAPNVALLARDLPGMEDFDFCFKIGATLFQGAFITSREQWEERNLGPRFAHLSMLLSKLRREDADTRELAALFKQDAALALRLLRYVNSAANGLQEHVSSIGRAIAILGRAPLRRWLTLLLCTIDVHQARSAAVLEMALTRARTMELIASSRPAVEREAMFLTGLLSLIDVVLRQPMERALATLSIDSEIRDAILREQGPYAATLALAKACESVNAKHIVLAAAACGADPGQASRWYMDALAWTLAQNEDA